MANKKKLQKAAAKYRRENLKQCLRYSHLLFMMKQFILTDGAPEVTVGYKGNKYYEHANI